MYKYNLPVSHVLTLVAQNVLLDAGLELPESPSVRMEIESFRGTGREYATLTVYIEAEYIKWPIRV